jgi:predicted nucleic acid-binding protein
MSETAGTAQAKLSSPPTIYLDTTVLLTYTLTRLVEKERYLHVVRLMDKVNAGQVVAFTSFYALHEVLIFAVKNVPAPHSGRQLGKEALLDILHTEVGVLPMVTREEKVLHARTFAALQDASDLSHAISAHLVGCQVFVSHDRHFAALPATLEWKCPEELVASL